MRLPTISGLFGSAAEETPPPITVEEVETTRKVRRIGPVWFNPTGRTGQYAVLFEDGPKEPVLMSSWNLKDRIQMLQLTLAQPGDRLRMVHAGDDLVEVENLDL
jgi:hypothetical protein